MEIEGGESGGCSAMGRIRSFPAKHALHEAGGVAVGEEGISRGDRSDERCVACDRQCPRQGTSPVAGAGASWSCGAHPAWDAGAEARATDIMISGSVSCAEAVCTRQLVPRTM